MGQAPFLPQREPCQASGLQTKHSPLGARVGLHDATLSAEKLSTVLQLQAGWGGG